ncbi:g9167 [Coccomyxa viridis]|uniref:G9167 protein n=1 Tax=Coccomyxa viridis TaxID=1274662 RepID=A0ABP1G290_9CHLO
MFSLFGKSGNKSSMWGGKKGSKKKGSKKKHSPKKGLYGVFWSLMGRVEACGEHHVVKEAEVLDGGTVLADACEHLVAIGEDGVALFDHVKVATANGLGVSSAAIICHTGVTWRQGDHSERKAAGLEVIVQLASVAEEAGRAR